MKGDKNLYWPERVWLLPALTALLKHVKLFVVGSTCGTPCPAGRMDPVPPDRVDLKAFQTRSFSCCSLCVVSLWRGSALVNPQETIACFPSLVSSILTPVRAKECEPAANAVFPQAHVKRGESMQITSALVFCSHCCDVEWDRFKSVF